MTTIKRLLGVLLLLIVCAACASGPIPSDGVSQEIEEYRLGPGDRIRINVFGEESVSGEFVVAPTGKIAYPLLGEFQAEGRTVSEFTLGLTEALLRYVRRPNVSVEVMNYRPYYILGEVRNPGTYPYTGGLTIFNAVAIAGGFTDRADTRRVFIKHGTEEREFRLTTDTRVQPGDTVRVPERRF